MDRFDPYLEWLGIEPGNRPPDHYQLLGLERFEGDQQAIALAADTRMAEIRKFQTGPRGRHTQALLNQLATARLCLLDAQAKVRYDEQLRQGPRHSVQPPDFAPVRAPATNLAPPTMPYGQSAASPLPTAPLSTAPLPASHLFPDVPAPPPPPPPPRAVSRPVSQPRTSVGGLGSPGPVRRIRVRRRDTGTNYLIALLLVCLGLAGVAWWVVQSGNVSRRTLGRVEPPTRTSPFGPGKTGPSKAGPDRSGPGNPLSPKQLKPPSIPPFDPSAPSRDSIDGPVVIEQEGSGVVNLPPAVAVLYGDSIQLGDQQQPDAITQWTSMEDWIEWHFRLVKPGVFRMMVRYAVDQDGVAGEFDVLVDGQVVRTCSLRAAGEGQSEVTDEYFIPLPRSGKHRLALRPASKPGTQLMRLFEIRLTPSSSSEEGS